MRSPHRGHSYMNVESVASCRHSCRTERSRETSGDNSLQTMTPPPRSRAIASRQASSGGSFHMHTDVTGSAIGIRSGQQRQRRARLATWIAAAALLALPAASQAQEAVVIGTVTDDSGGVMPG